MVAAGPDNPSVLEFFTERVLLGEIARSGLSTLGKGWQEKMSLRALNDGITTLPTEAEGCATMCVSTKPSLKGINAFFFKLVSEPGKRRKLKAIVVPTQIAIAGTDLDSEARFFSTWPRYEDELGSLGFISSIGIIFLWIVVQVPAGHQPEKTVPKGDVADHPGFIRRWVRADEASTAIGDLRKVRMGGHLQLLLQMHRPLVRRLPHRRPAGQWRQPP